MFDNSNVSLTFEPPIWMYHLTGGLSLLIGSNRTAAALASGQLVFFSMLPDSSPLALFVDQNRIRPIARSRFSSAEDMREPIVSNFTVCESNPNGECLAHAQSFFWDGIAVALHSGGKSGSALAARRVSSQIHLCLSRLERLSSAYKTVYSIVAQTSKVSSDNSFSLTSNKYSHYIGSE